MVSGIDESSCLTVMTVCAPAARIYIQSIPIDPAVRVLRSFCFPRRDSCFRLRGPHYWVTCTRSPCDLAVINESSSFTNSSMGIYFEYTRRVSKPTNIITFSPKGHSNLLFQQININTQGEGRISRLWCRRYNLLEV